MMNKREYKPSKTLLSGGNVYVDNSNFMEFVDDIATQITIQRFGEDAQIEVQDGLSDGVAIIFTEDAQDFYNEQYDWVETMLSNTLKIHSDERLKDI
jgi:hypothetical protein